MAGRSRVGLFRWVVLSLAVLCMLALGSLAPRAAARNVGGPVVASVAPNSDPIAVILSYADREQGLDDPLVQIDDQIWAKSSNVYGVAIGAQVFYYQLVGDTSFDPLSRGTVAPSEVVFFWRTIDDDAGDIIIYLLGPAARFRPL